MLPSSFPTFRGARLLLLGAACLGLSRPAPGAAAMVASTLPPPGAGSVFSAADQALLEDMQHRAFQYFVEQADPHTGLIRDRARADGSPSDGKASIAGSGFSLSAWVVATERGWTNRKTSIAQTRKALHFLDEQAPRRHGFFYHFMDMDTGKRAWACEVSPIDTGLFFAGAILARQYYADPEITNLVDKMIQDVDWEWFLNEGRTLSMSWTDERGFSRYRWDQYSEAMMLSFLGMGATEQPLPMGYWNAWSREPVGTYAGDHFIEGAPLFIHQYTHAYVDFRDRRDAYADYFHNSILASLAQRQFCIDLHKEFPAWDSRLWGLTSSDSDTGYRSWGGPPRTVGGNALDGTIVPCAAGGSLPFVPGEAMAAIETMRSAYGDRIWRRYGFVDAFNPITGWVDTDVIGIDLGIALLQAENARSGLIWRLFMQAPEVQHALQRAGFISERHDLTREEQAAWRAVAKQTWDSIEANPVDADTLGFALSSVLGAKAMGLIPDAEAQTRVSALLHVTAAPTSERGLDTYAAALIAVRQAFPNLAADASVRLMAIAWNAVPQESRAIGSSSRLTVFFKVATHAQPATAWVRQTRRSEAQGQVQVLEPAEVYGQLVPGIWLDEHAIASGASGAQLAYAIAIGQRENSTATFPYNVPDTALLLDHYPAEVSAGLKAAPLPAGWLAHALPSNRYLLFLSLSNLLGSNCLRAWFQRDPLVQTGRTLIPEFGFANFGANNSVFARNELAVPAAVPPERRAIALRAAVAREKWAWIDVRGRQFKTSDADMRPGDPEIDLRFALTWDAQALHFHAEVLDTPAGFAAPSGRRSVELFVNPGRGGLTWHGHDDFQFAYEPNGSAMEWFHTRPAAAKIHTTSGGYTVDADLPWAELGLKPHPGLEFDLSASVTAAGITEWDPALELSWRYYRQADDRIGLGTVQLSN